MKKYITIAALLAAGSALANAEEEILVLDSKITPTASNSSASISVQSAWNYVYGKGSSDISNTTSGPIYGTGVYSSTTSIFAGDRAKAIRLCDLFVSQGNTEGVEFISLQSLSFFLKSDGSDQPENVYVQVRDSAGTVVVTSGAISYGSLETGSTVWAPTATATFGLTNTLDFDSSYYFYFVDANGNDVSKSDGNAVGQGVVNPYYYGSDLSASYLVDGYNGWQSVIRLNAVVIPEPSAFGLLAGAGALALVASRRRRR